MWCFSVPCVFLDMFLASFGVIRCRCEKLVLADGRILRIGTRAPVEYYENDPNIRLVCVIRAGRIIKMRDILDPGFSRH